MSEAWEKVKLLPIPRSVGIFPADSWWYVMRALKGNIQNGADCRAEWQCSGVNSGVIFELHRIVLLLFFLLDAAKTSPQTQNICPLFVCRMKRNMK